MFFSSSGPYGNNGFYKATVCKSIMLALTALSLPVIFGPPGLSEIFSYTLLSIRSKNQIWRLFTSKLVFTDMKNLVLSLILLFNFRVIEKRYGSSKFSSCALASYVMSLGLETVALNLVPKYLELELTSYSPGPFFLIYSLFVPYFFDIPSVSPSSYFGSQLFGHKTFNYLLVLQLALFETDTTILALCGLLSGLLYRINFLRVQSWLRVPAFVCRFCDRYLSPLVGSQPPVQEGPVAMGATLEIQRQQQMDILEQQMLLSQFQPRNRGGGDTGFPYFRRNAARPPQPPHNSNPPQLHQPQPNGAADGYDEAGPHGSRPSPGLSSGSASEPSDEQIQQLTEMGFSRQNAIDTLRVTNNNIALATNLLLGDN